MENEWYELRDIRKTDSPFLQLRRFSAEGFVHIQGFGEEANRPYGFANKYSMPNEVVDAVRQSSLKLEYSLASEIKEYFRGVLEIVRYADGHQLIIKIKSDNNNDDGQFVLDMDSRADDLLNFAEENNLVTDRSSEQRFVSTVGEEE